MYLYIVLKQNEAALSFLTEFTYGIKMEASHLFLYHVKVNETLCFY